MLKSAQNERLVRVGPGTPMGEAFRRFWIPVCQLKDLEAGGAPLPVKLLGESLLAFRFCAGLVAGGLLAPEPRVPAAEPAVDESNLVA